MTRIIPLGGPTVDGKVYERMIDDFSPPEDTLGGNCQMLKVDHFHGTVVGGKYHGRFINEFFTNDDGCRILTTGARELHTPLENQEPIESDQDVCGFITYLHPYFHTSAGIHATEETEVRRAHTYFARVHRLLRGQFDPFIAFKYLYLGGHNQIEFDPRLARLIGKVTTDQLEGLQRAIDKMGKIAVNFNQLKMQQFKI